MITFPPKTEQEFAAWTRELAKIADALRAGLKCGLHDGAPCNTDRWALVDDMARYLELHGYAVTPPPADQISRATRVS